MLGELEINQERMISTLQIPVNPLILVLRPAKKKWNYTVDGIMSTPVVDVDGNIYFTSTNYTDENEQGGLYALDPNGKLKWKYTINNQFGSYALFPPVIGPDDIIYFTNDLLYTDREPL